MTLEDSPLVRVSWRMLVPMVLAIGGACWLGSGHSLQSAGELLTQSRQRIEATWGLESVAFVILGTGLMCLFVPKTFVSITAGSLFGFVHGGCLLATTAVVSALVNYQIGRWSLAAEYHTEPPLDGSVQSSHVDAEASGNLVGSLEEPKEIGPTAMTDRRGLLFEIKKVARTAGLGVHLMVRLTPVPTTIISYTMGAASARRVPYTVAALLAAIPQLLWVYCGASATSEDAMTRARLFGIACSVVAAIVLSVWIPRTIMRNWRRVTKQ